MRLLALTDRYPPWYSGGYEINCHLVMESLRERGHDVQVLTSTFGIDGPRVEGHVFRQMSFRDFDTVSGVGGRIGQLGLVAHSNGNYRLTRDRIRAFEPELVFIWHMLAVSVAPILAAQEAGVATAYRIGSHWLANLRHHYVDEPSAAKRRFRQVLLGGRRFEDIRLGPNIMVSESLRVSYAEAGLDVSQSIVVPSGVPDAWIAERPAGLDADETLRIVFAGRLEAPKGPQVLLAALDQLVNTHGQTAVSLDLIGRGEPEFVAGLQQFIADRGLAGHVSFVDFMPREDLVRRLRSYHVLAFPTLQWEGLPMMVVEGMSQGLVIVASDIGGPRDVVVHERNGLLFKPGNPESLADALQALKQQPARVAQYGAAALKTVRANFTQTLMIDRYEGFLEAVIKREVHA